MNNEQNPVYVESVADNKIINILDTLIQNQEGAIETSRGIWFRQSRVIQIIDAFLVSKYTTPKGGEIRFFNEMRKAFDTFVRKTLIRSEELNVDLPIKAWDFLLKKAHNEMVDDTYHNDFLYDYAVSLATYGTVVSKIMKRGKGKDIKKVVNFSSFLCDQNVAENHPMGEVFETNMENLDAMAKYDTEAVERLKAQVTRESNGLYNGTRTKIKLYEIHGHLPKSLFEEGATGMASGMFIVAKTDGNKKIVLYKGLTDFNPYTVQVINKIYNRTMGYGPMEAMIETQIASNELGNLNMNLLRATTKVVYQTDDTVLDGQELQDIDNLTIISHEEGKPITQLSTNPQAFPHTAQMMSLVRSMGHENAAIQDASIGRGPKSNVSYAAYMAGAKEADGVYSLIKLRILDNLQRLYKRDKGIFEMCIDYFDTNRDIEDLLSPTQLHGFKKFVAKKKAEAIVEEQVGEEYDGETYIDPVDEVADFLLKKDAGSKYNLVIDLDVDKEWIVDKARLTMGGESDRLLQEIARVRNIREILTAPGAKEFFPNLNPETFLLQEMELQDITALSNIDISQVQNGVVAQPETGPQVASQAGLTQ